MRTKMKRVLVFRVLVFQVLVFRVLVFQVLVFRVLGLSFPDTQNRWAFREPIALNCFIGWGGGNTQHSRIIVFPHKNHTKGFTAVFSKFEAISAHTGSKFLAC